MKNKRVAGTIMLHLQDGTKKFLMHENDDRMGFAITTFADEATGLSSILRFLKETVHVNVSDIQLVELTNTNINHENIPLFLFEIEEKNMQESLAADYIWERPEKLRTVLGSVAFEGVPFF
ncbi:hypothetical protein [Enterococcus sp. HY326]|uniref:hypothetical protein n=1 Tax=Enterococcus sp. HY326 TaxID=2971265 RepID=UPI0022404303|nr:hypothetical protein [Enterococcus sp. HY326]